MSSLFYFYFLSRESQLNQLLDCSALWLVSNLLIAHPNHNGSRFKEMHRQDPSLIFPMLVWDTFPRSGASQVNHRLMIIPLSLITMLVGKANFLLKQSIKISILFLFFCSDSFSTKAKLPQVHPHLQTWLGRAGYSGHFETQLRFRTFFNQYKKSDSYIY